MYRLFGWFFIIGWVLCAIILLVQNIIDGHFGGIVENILMLVVGTPILFCVFGD